MATKKVMKKGVANRLGRGNQDPFWFLKDDDDALKGVTSEASNKKLGIVNIAVYEPTPGMESSGVVAKVSIETTAAYIDGITVWNSKNGDGSIYLNTQSRSYEDNKGEKQYRNDTRLKRAAQAQILRYVWEMTTDAEAEVSDVEDDEDEE